MTPEPYTVGDRVTVRNTPMLADLGYAGKRGELVHVVGPKKGNTFFGMTSVPECAEISRQRGGVGQARTDVRQR